MMAILWRKQPFAKYENRIYWFNLWEIIERFLFVDKMSIILERIIKS
jgi:hypothetical protein